MKYIGGSNENNIADCVPVWNNLNYPTKSSREFEQPSIIFG